MEDRETARMRKIRESKTTRIMMATVPHVNSGLGLRKFQADGLLLTRVYVYPHVSARFEWKEFRKISYWRLAWQSVEKLQRWLKSEEAAVTSHEDLPTSRSCCRQH